MASTYRNNNSLNNLFASVAGMDMSVTTDGLVSNRKHEHDVRLKCNKMAIQSAVAISFHFRHCAQYINQLFCLDC